MPEVLTHPRRVAALAGSALAAVVALAGCTPPTSNEPTSSATATGSPGASPTAAPETAPESGQGTAPETAPESGPGTGREPGPIEPVGEPTVVATGLALPWSLVRVVAPADTAATPQATSTTTTLVSERDTALVKEVSDDGAVRLVGEVSGVVPGGEGGLLGLAVWVDGVGARWLYAYTTAASDNRVVRMRMLGSAGNYSLGSAETIFSGIPKASNHNGGRIAFGPDGALYATTGDAGQSSRAQDLTSLGGKILRLTPLGRVPADNPFEGSPIYSLGHRNPQGITWDGDGNLWACEFGQNTWDELNLITPGSNYGWPKVEGIGRNPAYLNPTYQWATSEASPSGLLWNRDTLFVAALRGERLWTVVTQSQPVTATPFFTGQFGRLRDVIEGPNGSLWILTNNTGRAPRDGDDKILEVRLDALDKG